MERDGWRRRAEAMAWLIAARMAVRTVPFAWLVRSFARSPKAAEATGHRRRELRCQVRDAIQQASRLLPGETVCLPKAMAAQAMLRRRGVSTTLICGAARAEGGRLTGHVWLQDDEIGITGAAASLDYRPLQAFSPPSLTTTNRGVQP